jgi:NAD(P)-dependent dehydrogenase (short-subunit alcohol dehydrogenase family)
VAVVTGAASGIGLGIASHLADAGARVVLADVDERRLAREVDRLGQHRGHGVVCDVGDPAALAQLAEEALGRFGAVHIICNNAGIMRAGRSWELSAEDWNTVLRVNLLAVIHGVRIFLPLILSTGQEGHVINMASMAGMVPVKGIGPYNVAKHGVLALSDTLKMELADAGAPVGVSVVMPGRVPSRLGRPPEDPIEPSFDPNEPGLLPASEVGRIVVEAVREDRMYVFTHPERISEVEARFARITAH